MNSRTRFSVAVVAVLACAVIAASDVRPASPTAESWESYWASKKIDPAPPKGFLDTSYSGRVDNLTGGRISDETARKWVLASLRRGTGDQYAQHHLREDIANADIFGPPGLNGTGHAIQLLRKKGVEKVEAPGMPDIVAAAVIAVPKEMQAEDPRTGLTDYVIVLVYRVKPGKVTLTYRDGRSEVIEGKNDERLRRQLDTGHYFEHPVLGPLWYQKSGWSCQPDATVVGKLCGRVVP